MTLDLFRYQTKIALLNKHCCEQQPYHLHKVENMVALETAAGTLSAHDLRLREQTAFSELIQSLKLQNFTYSVSP